MADPDYQVHAGYMEAMQRPEHFGNTRSVRELLEFSKLAVSDKATADRLYVTMKRFEQVPMKDCLAMVKGRGGDTTPAKKVDPNKIREQAERLAGGVLTSGSEKVSESEEIKDMDDAWDVDD